MKVRYYNPNILYTAESLVRHPKAAVTHAVQSLFNPGISLMDRTGTLAHLYPFAAVDPMPDLSPISTSFSELCKARTLQLHKAVVENGSGACIFYSGGIDSTLILTQLMSHVKESDHYHYTVVLNEASIIENPKFFNILRTFFNIGVSDNFNRLLTPNQVNITGECADNLFGSLTMRGVILSGGEETINADYHPVLRNFITHKIQSPVLAAKVEAELLKLIEACPVKLTTAHDVFWWLNFTLKWQAVLYRMLVHKPSGLNSVNGHLEKWCFHFFNTQEFQRWAVHNLDLKIKDTWKSYKWLAKELIYEVFDDDDYLKNKTKVPSLPSILRFRNVYNAISESGTLLDKLQVDHLLDQFQ